ncbi:terpene synthase [Chitinophaga sp. SYP-B3965]|uniref:terpene synthase family protein n=1 Tax=Chitinophaga sp. SYP-B3965 TaxID=2663120 RepID=UPI0012997EF4|nr:terpene synthase [Chitinophaga sp. SYP-B3965]MRG45205.1 terpene synthase [Chitinophaga sp. SYP-B3965]
MITRNTSGEDFLTLIPSLPRPEYPFPDLANPLMEPLREVYYNWIDTDYTFHSEKAREMHKRHVLSDIPARAFPYLRSIDELLPITRYACHGAMMDDYFDRCTGNEMQAIRERIMSLLRGEDEQEPKDLGIYRQFYLLRQDAIRCEMPQRLYDKYIVTIDSVLVGYQQEKHFNAADIPPPLPIYTIIREDTSGGLPFCRYVCMQKDFRLLPDTVLDHPVLVRMYALVSRMIGCHNDFISLPKEIMRQGDVINIVKVMRHEYDLSWEDAYRKALDLHDDYKKEFILLCENLPDFGKWQELAADFVYTLGISLQGVYSWHLHDKFRYAPGGYVEGEYKSRE